MHQPNPARLDLLRRWAVLLDSAFRVPGTNFRFGVDAILGLVPGLGDLSAPIYAAFILMTGFRMRVRVTARNASGSGSCRFSATSAMSSGRPTCAT